MSTLTAETITRLQERLARLEAQIESANDALDSLVTQEIESFTLNTGEGSQSSKRWEANKLDQLIARLEKRAEHIRQRLCGLGVVNFNMRRKEGL